MSHGTSLSLSEEDEVSREETQKVPLRAASLDSLGWGSLAVRCSLSGKCQDNVTGGTGTGAGQGWVALFFPEQWAERWWGRGSVTGLGAVVGGRRVLLLAVAPGTSPAAPPSFPAWLWGWKGRS